jgi:hypothetical protein
MKRTLLVLALALACAATRGPATELSERGTDMFDAMLGAMDAMGLVERGRKHRSSDGGDWSSASGSNSGMPGSSSFGGWPAGMPGSGFGMPGASAFGMPGASAFGMPGASPFGMPGASPFGMPGASPFGMPGASAFGMPGSSPFGSMSNPMSPWSSMPWTGGGMPQTPWSRMPWSGAQMPGMPQMPGDASMPMPSMPATPWAGSRPQESTASDFLDGSWEGQSGELLLIRRGMFRIYADAQTYRDGHLQVQGNRLQLKDAESGRTREYEMRYQSGQLALRTPEGDVMLYRRNANDGH